MKTKLSLAFAVFLAAVALGNPGMAATNSGNTSVTVNVTSTMKIDVAPNSLSYQGVQPGSSNATSDRGYTGIEIENIGSTNVTSIWADNSHPSARPFGTGVASAYNTGNFIQIQPSGEIGGTTPADGNGFHFISRKEYNESNELSYVQMPGGGDEWRYGRFRTANESFFWALNVDSSSGSSANQCNAGGSDYFKLGKLPHSKENLGSVDFSDATQIVDYGLSDGPGDYGRVNDVEVQTYEGNKTYSVFTWCGGGTAAGDNSTHVYFSRYGVSATGTTATQDPGSLEYLMNSTTSSPEDELQPGEHFTVFTRVSVPLGTSEGAVQSGKLSIFASNN